MDNELSFVIIELAANEVVLLDYVWLIVPSCCPVEVCAYYEVGATVGRAVGSVEVEVIWALEVPVFDVVARELGIVNGYFDIKPISTYLLPRLLIYHLACRWNRAQD